MPNERKQGKKAPSGATILRGLYKHGGIRSVYRGSLMTFARDAPDSAAYFATYEYCKKKLTPKQEDGAECSLSLLAVSVAGASAGTVMVTPLFPIDTVKTRLQAAEGKPRISSTVKSVYSKGGVKAFFPGLGLALLRAIRRLPPKVLNMPRKGSRCRITLRPKGCLDNAPRTVSEIVPGLSPMPLYHTQKILYGLPENGSRASTIGPSSEIGLGLA